MQTTRRWLRPALFTLTLAAGLAGAGQYASVTAQAASTTSTTVQSSLSPSRYGQQVTFTASVSCSAAAPTGTVTFLDGTTPLGSRALSGTTSPTTAMLSTATLSAGAHTIVALYGGDSSCDGSASSSITQTVIVAATSTSLSAPSSANAGQPVTLTATVNVTPPGAGTPTGSVTFYDNAATSPVNLGTATLGANGNPANQASLTSTTLPAGSNSVSAQYNGDSNFAQSASSAQTVQINQGATATTVVVSSSSNPSQPGQPVTFTGQATSTAGTPIGALLFSIFGPGAYSQIAQCTLVNGQCSIAPITFTAEGAYTVQASFPANGSYGAGSGQLAQLVGSAAAIGHSDGSATGINSNPLLFVPSVTPPVVPNLNNMTPPPPAPSPVSKPSSTNPVVSNAPPANQAALLIQLQNLKQQKQNIDDTYAARLRDLETARAQHETNVGLALQLFGQGIQAILDTQTDMTDRVQGSKTDPSGLYYIVLGDDSYHLDQALLDGDFDAARTALVQLTNATKTIINNTAPEDGPAFDDALRSDLQTISDYADACIVLAQYATQLGDQINTIEATEAEVRRDQKSSDDSYETQIKALTAQLGGKQ